jgi:hypothetical protein
LPKQVAKAGAVDTHAIAAIKLLIFTGARAEKRRRKSSAASSTASSCGRRELGARKRSPSI